MANTTNKATSTNNNPDGILPINFDGAIPTSGGMPTLNVSPGMNNPIPGAILNNKLLLQLLHQSIELKVLYLSRLLMMVLYPLVLMLILRSWILSQIRSTLLDYHIVVMSLMCAG